MKHPRNRRPLLLATTAALFALAAGPITAVVILIAAGTVHPALALFTGVLATTAAVCGYVQLRAYRDASAMETIRQLLDDDSEVDHLLNGFDDHRRNRTPAAPTSED